MNRMYLAQQIEDEITTRKQDIAKIESDIQHLRASYAKKKAIYNELEKNIVYNREDIDFAEMGAYEPHFDLDTSEEYKQSIKNNREKQKIKLKDKSKSGAYLVWYSMDSSRLS